MILRIKKWDPTGAPNWAPLENALGDGISYQGEHTEPDDYMWMGQSLTVEGLVIQLYKHRDTRHYLNIDEKGQFYKYLNASDAYQEIDIAEALTVALNLPQGVTS